MLTVLILYVAEKVNGGIFLAALPPNGQIQMIVGGKCKYKLTINYYRISLKLILVGTIVVSFSRAFYVSHNGNNVCRTELMEYDILGIENS